MIRAMAAILVSLWSLAADAQALRPCFVPGEDCARAIVAELDAAQSEILVQAYGLTSPAIIQALGRASERPGLQVRAILDRTNEQARYTGATYLANHGIPVLIDDRVAVAHNKVIIVDRETVITGSFNFTESAQRRNAENVLIVRGRSLAELYRENWERRAAVSRPQRPR